MATRFVNFQSPNSKNHLTINSQVSKEISSIQAPVSEKRFDLDERTLIFTQQVVLFCKGIPKNESNTEYSKQVIRSVGSIGANYSEANDALGRKDFLMRIRICRKEAKETVYWLQVLLATNDERLQPFGTKLLQEGIELKEKYSLLLF